MRKELTHSPIIIFFIVTNIYTNEDEHGVLQIIIQMTVE